MLTRILTAAHIALALAGAFACASIGYVALTARPVIVHLNGVLTRAEAVESKVYATAGNLDKATAAWAAASQSQTASVAALTQQATVTLESAAAAIGDIRATVATINTAAAQAGPLLASARAATDSIPQAVSGINQTVADLRAPIDAGARTLIDLDAMLRGPELAASLRSTAAITANTEKMSADAQQKFHLLLYPAPCVGRWCWARKGYEVVKAASDLAEPAYWAQQLLFAH